MSEWVIRMPADALPKDAVGELRRIDGIGGDGMVTARTDPVGACLIALQWLADHDPEECRAMLKSASADLRRGGRLLKDDNVVVQAVN